jgi:DNA-binding Lrp family transcriptional regulator
MFFFSDMPSIDLDVKDRKILLALDMDARQPDSKIAAAVGLSKQLTNYRIKRLEKQNIIQSYYPVIDHTKLGLKLYRIGIKLENVTKKKEQEILYFLKKHTSWIVSVLGKWDIWMALHVKDEYEFMEFWDQFYNKYGFYIEKRWISLMTRFWNYERSFIFPEKGGRDKLFLLGQHHEISKVNDIDRQILQELTRNARQPTLEISKNLNQTERIVRYRLKRLEKQKAVLGYRSFVNTSRLGYKYYKLFIQLKETKKEDIRNIRSYIQNNPNVVYSTEALGGYDFELEVHFRDSQDLINFISDMKETFPMFIKDVEHMEYIKEHKVTYYPSEGSNF